jgi:hypothetical protein
MCMSCNSGKFTKRRIITLSLLGVGVAAGIYFAFSTDNPTIAAAVPALTAFAICPVMCAAIGGLMWFMSRSSKNKDKTEKDVIKNKGMSPCCSDINPRQSSDYKIQQKQLDNTKLSSSDKREPALDVRYDNSLLSSSQREQESIYKN